MFDTITIKNARLHNLKNVTLSIPKNQLVVFTGLSGSGKSTLAIDTLHKESLRQLFEALGMVDYAGKPEVDRIEGLSPSIAIDQQAANRSPRSMPTPRARAKARPMKARQAKAWATKKIRARCIRVRSAARSCLNSAWD